MNAAIAQRWSGQFGAYNVKVNIIPKGQYTNYVNVIAGKGGSEAGGNNSRTAWLYTKEANGSTMEQAMGHELGHLVGTNSMPHNKYTNDGRAFPGWEDNIMGNSKGKVEERNIIDILEFGRSYLGKKENIFPGSVAPTSSSSNNGPSGCMAKGGNCWN